MDPRTISINDYSYFLPEEKIASYPLPDRDSSRLLIYENGLISEDKFAHLAAHLPANSSLFFNNSKVVAARILFQKPSGGTIEVFCLEPSSGMVETALLRQGSVTWNCLVGGASKWKKGQVLELRGTSSGKEFNLHASIEAKTPAHFEILFSWQPATLPFIDILHAAGAIPLPPYIKRAPDLIDTERYQTIYATTEGSVAAPTAGLHFTDQVFEQLNNKGIHSDYVTLHVGAGTFQPVKKDLMSDHEMHAEFIDVSRQAIEGLLQDENRTIIAVGTTSLRTLETLYWLGIKMKTMTTGDENILSLSQWEAYELSGTSITARESFSNLVEWMDREGTHRLLASTRLLIAPGYTFRVAQGLITNFHQPRSTLLLLVAAFIGEDWRTVYDYALKNEFRFLSYGDGSLLWRAG